MVVFMADRQKATPKGSATVKKVTSSHNVRPAMDSADGELSPADKKRNKLGYHRTAVACGHCRRRKIRCIPSADPTSTRCQNCIRLKKDCQFYPVEQNAAIPPKPSRTDSKGDTLTTESETSVSSSSPHLQTGVSGVEQYDRFRVPIEGNAMPQEGEYPPPPYDQRQWYPTDPTQHPYWLQHDNNHQNSYMPSPYPMTPTSNGQPVTPHRHAYTYPGVSLEHQNYTYPMQSPRDGQIPGHAGSVASFGEYRANTVPERIAMPNDSYRGHDMQTTNVVQPVPTHLMGSHYQPVHGSAVAFSPPTSQQPWMAVSSETQQHTYALEPGTLPTWYNHGDGMNHIRKENSMNSPAREDSSRVRQKPG